MKVISGGSIDYRAKIFRRPVPFTINRGKVFLPVSEEGTDDALGIFRDLHVVWEVEGVLVVHDFTIRSNQRICVERRVTWRQLQKVGRKLVQGWDVFLLGKARKKVVHILTDEHLKDEDANGPPVTLPPVESVPTLRLQHLGRDVVGCPDRSVAVHHASLQHKTWESTTYEAMAMKSLRSPLTIVTAAAVLRTYLEHLHSPSSCTCQSQPAWGVHVCPAACCQAWRPDGWSPWSGWRPEPSPPLPCRTWPTSLGRRRCWWGWPGHPLAYTPWPCRGNARLGRHNTTERWWHKSSSDENANTDKYPIITGWEVNYLHNPGTVGKGHDVPLFPEESRVWALDHLKFA